MEKYSQGHDNLLCVILARHLNLFESIVLIYPVKLNIDAAYQICDLVMARNLGTNTERQHVIYNPRPGLHVTKTRSHHCY